MRTETRTVKIGEWLGDVPADWDYEGFYTKHLSMDRNSFDKAVALYKEMASALQRGANVYATTSSGFVYEVYRCGLYDGWVFWVPRPCYSYAGPIPGEHKEEFYNLRGLRIKEA